MKLDRLSLQHKITGGAMAVVLISAFLPWVSFFGVSLIGVEGDGVITLILAIAGLVLLILTTGVFGTEPKFAGRGADIASIVLGGLVALIGIIDMNSLASIGLYLTLLGGLAWLGGAIWQLTESMKNEQPKNAPQQQYPGQQFQQPQNPQQLPPQGYPGQQNQPGQQYPGQQYPGQQGQGDQGYPNQGQ